MTLQLLVIENRAFRRITQIVSVGKWSLAIGDILFKQYDFVLENYVFVTIVSLQNVSINYNCWKLSHIFRHARLKGVQKANIFLLPFHSGNIPGIDKN